MKIENMVVICATVAALSLMLVLYAKSEDFSVPENHRAAYRAYAKCVNAAHNSRGHCSRHKDNTHFPSMMADCNRSFGVSVDVQ